MGILFGGERRAAAWGVVPPVLPWSQASTVGVYGGGSFNPASALQVSAFWACVNLMANSVSMMKLEGFRETDGVPERLTPQPPLLRQPSGTMTQSQWLREFMVSEMCRGNAVGLVTARDGNQYPTKIRLLNPDSVSIEAADDTGAAVYKWSTSRTVIPSVNVFHVPGLTMPGDVEGMSPISYAAMTLGINLSARKFGKDFLDGDGVPKAVIESDLPIDQAQARTLKDRFLEATRNREPIAMGSGVTVKQIQIKPEESQFLATIQASDTEIARFCGVPPAMIGAPEGSNMTYSNREQRALDFLTYGVAFWLKRIEDAVSSVLPERQYVKFDTSALLRIDAETEARVDVQRLAGKVLAPSEIRARMGLPPMTAAQKEEADLVPLTVTPLGGAKALPAITQPPGPVAPVPAAEQGGSSA